MHRYDVSTPRVALGIAAFALTAITFGVAVVLPTTVEADDSGLHALATSRVPTLAAIHAAVASIALDEEGAEPCEPGEPASSPVRPNQPESEVVAQAGAR